MGDTPPPTVLTLKQSFLSAQTRLLAQPLGPSRAWHHQQKQQRKNADANADALLLPDKAVDDALVRLNHALAQHERRVHPAQATRHVAEQIDRLYWDDAARDAARGEEELNGEGGGARGDVLAGGGVDFTDPDTIASLPPGWASVAEADAHPLEARRYADLVARLQDTAAQTRTAALRVARLQRLHETLAPFRGGSGDDDEDSGNDAVAGVQENLVTRNGEVERELERMRVLLARVGGRVARLQRRGPRRDGERGGEEEEEEVVETSGQFAELLAQLR